jgi:2-hydroxy-3-keto-5-methylthiopentenyl-1-phosphate phosphatase
MHIICNIDGATDPSDRLHLDPTFVELMRACGRWKVAVSLVSDDLEDAVYGRLNHHRLGLLPAFADRRVGGRLEHPFRRPGCANGAGVCRCLVAGVWSEPKWPTLVYVGHAASDDCMARGADLLFARDALAEAAEARGQSFTPFKSFDDVQRALDRQTGLVAGAIPFDSQARTPRIGHCGRDGTNVALVRRR